MNERIKQLMVQAGFDIERLRMHPGGWPREDLLVLEDFAKLIVRECARVARATPAPNFHEHLKQQLGHTWDMAAIEAGREIVKHFGVEK